MGKYSGILLCSDFDSTLSTDGVISKENIEAIKYFRQNGGLFTIASGRYYDFLLPFFEGYEFGVPLITLNGAVFYDVEKKKICREIFISGLTKEYINDVFENADAVHQIVLFTENGLFPIKREERDLLNDADLSRVYKLSLRVADDIETSNKATAIIKTITPDFLDVARSWYWGIEVQGKESTKGPATRALANMIGADTLVCAGDFENDIGMIKEADIGYAVGNAIASLKEVADRVTVKVTEHAIAKIISEL